MSQVDTGVFLSKAYPSSKKGGRLFQGVIRAIKELPANLLPPNTIDVIDTYDAKTIAHHLNPLEKVQRQLLKFIGECTPKVASKLAYSHMHKARKRIRYTKLDLPEGASAFALSYRQGKLKGYSWGRGQKIVYLIHGWESALSLMSGFIEPLIQAGYKVIAFDAPSHGHSDNQATCLPDFINALEHVIQRNGKPHTIIGHSCGGAATALLLKRNKTIRPEKVVLLAPMSSLQIKLDIFSEVAQLAKAVKAKLSETLEQVTGGIETFDVAKAAKSLTTPALIIHDQEDTLIPQHHSFEITQNWQNSRLSSTCGLGHIRLLFNEHVIRETTQFVQENK